MKCTYCTTIPSITMVWHHCDMTTIPVSRKSIPQGDKLPPQRCKLCVYTKIFFYKYGLENKRPEIHVFQIKLVPLIQDTSFQKSSFRQVQRPFKIFKNWLKSHLITNHIKRGKLFFMNEEKKTKANYHLVYSRPWFKGHIE